MYIFRIDIEENVTIKRVQNFKYLAVSLNKKGINSEDLQRKASNLLPELIVMG